MNEASHQAPAEAASPDPRLTTAPSRKRVPKDRRSVTSLLAVMSAVLAAVVTVGSIYLHAVGLVYQGAYLGAFGVVAGQFPASTSDLMLYGYIALLDRGFRLSALLFSEPLSWVVLALGYLYIRGIRWMDRLPARPVKEIPGWVAWMIREMVLPIVLTFAAVLLLVATVTLFWGALSVGHYAGLAQAEQDKAEATKPPCAYCAVVETNGGTVGGRVVAASVVDIAIYDPEARRTHVISRSVITSMTTQGFSDVAPDAPTASSRKLPAATSSGS